MGLKSDMLVNATGTLSDAQLAAVKLFKGYPDGLIKFSTVFCLFIMLIGIPGNIVTIFALACYKNVQNVTAIFLINLTCSDLLFCCFNLPLETSKFHQRAWIHGQFLCKMSFFTRYALIVNSSLTVTAISITRYIIIVYPNLYSKLYKKRNIMLWLLCSWMFSIGIMVPVFFEENYHFDLEISTDSCLVLKDQTEGPIKKNIFLAAFILPCTAIILCYTKIFCIVKKTTKRSKTKKRLPSPMESSSDNLSTHVPVPTSESARDKILESIIPIKLVSTKNKRTIDLPTNLEMSDRINRQSEILEKESPKLHQTILNKSIRILKMALPTRKDKRLGTMIIAIIMSFFLCYLPIIIIKVFLERNLHPKLNITAHLLFYLSHCLNIIIYVVMSNEYRKAYKNLFKPKKMFVFSK